MEPWTWDAFSLSLKSPSQKINGENMQATIDVNYPNLLQRRPIIGTGTRSRDIQDLFDVRGNAQQILDCAPIQGHDGGWRRRRCIEPVNILLSSRPVSRALGMGSAFKSGIISSIKDSFPEKEYSRLERGSIFEYMHSTRKEPQQQEAQVVNEVFADVQNLKKLLPPLMIRSQWTEYGDKIKAKEELKVSRMPNFIYSVPLTVLENLQLHPR
jgi:hypothetical protein